MIQITKIKPAKPEFNVTDERFQLVINLDSTADYVDNLSIKVSLVAPNPALDQKLGTFSVQIRKGELSFTMDCDMPAIHSIDSRDILHNENYFLFIDFSIHNKDWFRSYALCNFKYNGTVEIEKADEGSEIGSEEPVSEDESSNEEEDMDNHEEEEGEEEEEEEYNEEESSDEDYVKKKVLDPSLITFAVESVFKHIELDNFPSK